MDNVEIINNSDGTFSLRVFDRIVMTGTREECELRASFE